MPTVESTGLRGKLANLRKALSLAARDRNVRHSLRALLYHLASFDRVPPTAFGASLSAWGENFTSLQRHHHAAAAGKTRYDEASLELYPALADEAAREASAFRHPTTFTIFVTAYGPPDDQLAETLRSVAAQLYRPAEVCLLVEESAREQFSAFASGPSALGAGLDLKLVAHADLAQNLAHALNACLADCRGDFVAFLSAGDRLTRNATFEVARLIDQHPDADVVYSDEERSSGDDSSREFRKPGWSPDLLLSVNYLRNFLCCRAEAVRAAGGFSGRFEDDIKYDLLLRVVARAERVRHFPEVLYRERVPKDSYPAGFNHDASQELHKAALRAHLSRLGVEAEVGDGLVRGSFRVRRKLVGSPRVSVVIPTRDRVELLRQCVESIESKSTYRNYEIVIVDNASSEPAALNYLAATPHRVVRYPGEFNYSKVNNLGAELATGEHLLFLNNDTQVIAPDWLEALLEHSQRAEVGAVGAKLLYPDGSVQNAGVVLRPDRLVGQVHKFTAPDGHGYHGLADVVRNFNAVTGACVMLRADVFREVGGFDEDFPVTYNDLDLCLRVRSRGYLIVYTPYALLYHYEGVSVSSARDGGEFAEIEVAEGAGRIRVPVPRGQAEQPKLFYSRWKEFVHGDRYYSAEELT